MAGALPATPWLRSLRMSVLPRVRQSPPLMGTANPIEHNCASRHDGADRLANTLHVNIKAHFSYLSKFVLIIMMLGMVISFPGCGINFKEAPIQNSFALSPIPDSAVTILSIPTLTSTLESPLPILTSTPKPSLSTPSLKKATPFILDPNHWRLFTSPIDVLQSDVKHIGQSGDGTIWFGGLQIYRYDGKNWSIYNQEKIPGFHGHVIESLAVARDGTVWVGTEKNEIVSFDGTAWTSQTVEDGGYRSNDIVSIVLRKNGELCAISIEGMSCQSAGKWTRYPIIVQDTARQVYVWNAALTPLDEIWVPLSNGVLYHYDGKNWENIKVSTWIHSISSSQDGSLWIFDPDGFAKRDIQGKIVYKTIPNAFWAYPPTAMQEAADGTIWFGTGAGYQLAQYVNGSFLTVDGKVLSNSEKYDHDIFPFYLVHCIFQAKDGSMWFGTVNGIFRYK